MDNSHQKLQPTIPVSFFAGALAGVAVDVGLFPLDTLKTRLQSQYGFWKSGGFSGIYKGIGPTAIGAAPCAAVFFASYNGFKYTVEPHFSQRHEFPIRMVGAAFAETVSCVVRVPTEIVKQRRQACADERSSWGIVKKTLRREGPKGMFRGFWATVLRDAPFSVIQYPLWEWLKRKLNMENDPLGGAFCGALAGAFAGGVTTPLDVIKTRLMLQQTAAGVPVDTMMSMAGQVYKSAGIIGLFAGFIPRTVWILLGGGIYFGVYEQACIVFTNHVDQR